MPQYSTFTEGKHANEFLVSEAEGNRSREQIVVSSGADLSPGTVLGQVSLGALTSAAKAGGNTGNGTLTVDATTPVLANAKAGVYTVRMLTATTYRVTDPVGVVLGDGAIGTAFADRIKFNMAAGGTPFVAGDGFDLTLAVGSLKYKQLNPSALDGSQNAAGILRNWAYAASADKNSTAYVRECEYNGREIVWPPGITTPQLSAAIAQLTALQIIGR